MENGKRSGTRTVPVAATLSHFPFPICHLKSSLSPDRAPASGRPRYADYGLDAGSKYFQ